MSDERDDTPSAEQPDDELPVPVDVIEVRDLVTKDGRNPYREWFRGLRDKMARVRIESRIARVRTGNMGDCKPVGGGVFELRIDYGPGYRVYFGKAGDKLVILIGAGDKSTQDRDITKAQDIWEENKGSIEQ